MAVVVSDTTPLHYLILIGRDSVLKQLYGQVIVPPAVLQDSAIRLRPRQFPSGQKRRRPG